MNVVKESHPLEVTRDKIKELYMRFNFDVGTDKELFSHYVRGRKLKFQHDDGITFKEAGKLYNLKFDGGEEYTFDEWVVLKEIINDIQGKSWGNLIFWWTSLIQIKTIHETLKDTGIRIYNVYDGFYAPPGITKQYLVKTVRQSADYVYAKYIKNMPNPY